MTRLRSTIVLTTCIGAASVGACAVSASRDWALMGGPAAIEIDGPTAFSLPLPGISREDRRAFAVGNSFFRDNWVVAPASAEGRDGLGPIFNANSCSACHQEDGRGRPPVDRDDVGKGMVVFVSPRDSDGAPHPVYGGQLQDQGVPGVAPEVRIAVEPESIAGRYPDGTAYELRRWKVALAEPAYGPLGEVRLSMRIGQQLVGMGLLEAIDERDILAREDPEDRDGDGISGRAHRVTGADGTVGIGRFGWKASQPTLEGQVIAALHGDIGITSPHRADEDLTSGQRAAISAPSGGAPEIDAHKIGRIAHYMRALAVPNQRRSLDAEVVRGRVLFEAARCTACHLPEARTGGSSPLAELRSATIHPYTDLLLHDMGEGLADDRRDGDASGREWRTPPLWGIGLLETVNGNQNYLHDGRARTIEEAILWHGGEAQRSRDAFATMNADERAAMLAFLSSL
jgi:CxxC motif-containing protein (DUF1111 family)